MPQFQLTNGEKLFYIDENQPGAHSILLLHGLGVNSNSWILQLPPLVKAGYRVIAPDLPGFGQSRNAKFCGFPRLASISIELIQSLGVSSMAVMGLSMGGIVAQQIALDFPQRVDCLILANTLAKLNLGNPMLWPYYLSRLVLIQTKGLEAQANVVASHLFPRPQDELYRQAAIESIKESDLESYRAAMRAIARVNFQKRLNEIQCPTLVITGMNDETVPEKTQLELVHGIPGAKHVIIPDAGHAVCIDQAELFNRSVIEFLELRFNNISQSTQVPV